MYNVKSIFKYSLIILLFLSCTNKREDIKKNVIKWTGRVIILPRDVNMKLGMKDTICADMFTEKFKVVVYIDSLGCTACKLRIYEWRELVKKITEKYKNVSFLFYVNSNDYKDFQYKLVSNNFNYPVIFDYKDKLNSTNHLSKDLDYQTFLLDQNNKIVLVGNPIRKPQLLNLYLQQISK